MNAKTVFGMNQRDPYGLNELEPHVRLCHAIIIQAIKDYRSALRRNNLARQHEIESFFRSEWYYGIFAINGEVLIKKLRKEYHDENHKAVSRNHDSD